MAASGVDGALKLPIGLQATYEKVNCKFPVEAEKVAALNDGKRETIKYDLLAAAPAVRQVCSSPTFDVETIHPVESILAT